MDGIKDIEYLGCWNDCGYEEDFYPYYLYGTPEESSYLRTLPYLLNNSQSVMTIDLCRQHAVEQAFPYFALQSGGQCFAGTNLTLATSLGPSDVCNIHCHGNVKEVCGGSVRFIFFPN